MFFVNYTLKVIINFKLSNGYRISIHKSKSSEDNVIRLPKGPDGTPGFNIRR